MASLIVSFRLQTKERTIECRSRDQTKQQQKDFGSFFSCFLFLVPCFLSEIKESQFLHQPFFSS